MKHSDALDKIAPALLAAQNETPAIKRTAKNPFYSSSYAPLDEILAEIRPIYNKHGLTILQDITPDGSISTFILHSSGQWIQQDGMNLPLDKQTPQGAGSAVTYGRRYALKAMIGLADDDDDGNNAEKGGGKKTDKKTPEQIADEKLKALPDNIKDGFKHLGIVKKNTVWQFCNDREWDNDRIYADINKTLDAQVPA